MQYVDVVNAASFVFGVVGLAYAFYQGTERKRFAHFIRSRAWALYAKSNNATGIVQHALRMYKDNYADRLDPLFLELLAKADAFAQDLFKETISQIQIAEPEFNSTSISRWIEEEKVGAEYKGLFQQVAVESKRKRRFRKTK